MPPHRKLWLWWVIPLCVALVTQHLTRKDAWRVALEGKRVVITGASSGIGEQLAYVHCSAGASVLIVARSGDRLAKVADECRQRGGSCTALSADLSKLDGCGKKVLAAAQSELGGIDILILNHIKDSGAYDNRGWLASGGAKWKSQLALLRSTFDVNTLSFVALATTALPELEASRGGIVVVSSVAGKMGLPAVAAYSASKHALHGFFDSLRHDLANSGSWVAITTAVLGSIDTENAHAGTTLPDGSTALPNVAWSPPDDCAKAIARGGALRLREVYFPYGNIVSTLTLGVFIPETLDAIIRAFMGPPLAEQFAVTAARIAPSPAELKWGALYVAVIYSASLLLHLAVPAVTFSGYVLDADSSEPLTYRLNGLRVLLLVVLPLVGTSAGRDLLVDVTAHFRSMLCVSFALGLVLSLALYLRGAAMHRGGKIDTSRRCRVRGSATQKPQTETKIPCPEFQGRSPVGHFYCGFEWNPRYVLGRVDGKMFLYLAGAVMLSLNILGAAVMHAQDWKMSNGLTVSNAMVVYLVCSLWFCVDYLYFEDVHTYTYDLFAERLGFKLVWGCLCFYPFFYCVGVWSILGVSTLTDISVGTCVGIALLFLGGWSLTRGANMQKFLHKSPRHPPHATQVVFDALRSAGWLSENEVVEGSGGRLLCSGWWSLSRHVNYFGEILQAIALAMPGWLATGSLTPWLYPLYYVVLFVPRQREDDEACAIKYGDGWARYCTAVPYRIVPGLF